MKWLPFALLASLAMASADRFIKFSSGKLSNTFEVLTYSSCTFLLSLFWTWKDRLSAVDLLSSAGGVLGGMGVGASFGLTPLFFCLWHPALCRLARCKGWWADVGRPLRALGPGRTFKLEVPLGDGLSAFGALLDHHKVAKVLPLGVTGPSIAAEAFCCKVVSKP